MAVQVKVRNEKSWRRLWKPDLKSQAWELFNVDGVDYQVKSHFVESECSYELCISDLDRIWYEKVDDETIFNDRAKILNPNVEANTPYLLRHIQKNIEKQQEDTEYWIKKVRIIGEEDKTAHALTFFMKSKLQAGVPFVWEFQCDPGSHDMFGVHLVQPMLAMISELNRRQADLYAVLKKKDLEIKEYKDSGVRLSRKSLGTPEFDETAFSSKMILSQGFEDAVRLAPVKAFSGTLSELYQQVMIKTSWLQQKYTYVIPPAEEDEEVPETLPVLDTDDPPTTISPRGSPKKTPMSSPLKVASPSKDIELQRREELQKKLAADAEKKKRKKRKINL